MSAGLLPDGQRLLALADPSGFTFGIVRLDAAGQPIMRREVIALDPVPEALGPDGRLVLGEVRLADRAGFTSTSFRGLSLFDGSGAIFGEDFSFVPETRQAFDADDVQALQGWRFGMSDANLGYSAYYVEGKAEWLRLHFGEVRRGEAEWQGAGVAVEMVTIDGATVQLGGARYSRLTLDIWGTEQVTDNRPALDGWFQLNWHFQPPEGSDASPDSASSRRVSPPPFSRLTYSVALWMQDGVPRAQIGSPELWYYSAFETESHWASLAYAEGVSLHTAGTRAFAIDADGVGTETGSFDTPVSETRAWRVAGERTVRVAVCLPQENRVIWGLVRSPRSWRSLVRNPIEQFLGADGGFLFYPVSMDGSPDGRMYILDAGNARIVVLDRDGNYVTQFGTAGSGRWGFDFGDGNRIGDGRDLAGSIAVDEDGFIYVADVGNRRIQVFDP